MNKKVVRIILNEWKNLLNVKVLLFYLHFNRDYCYAPKVWFAFPSG